MDIIRASLKNPVALFMCAIGIILLGMIAFAELAIDLFPDISLPVITVQTEYEGASPQDIEMTITRLIEKRVSRIQNVRYVSSGRGKGFPTSRSSSTGADLNVASNDIQQSINQILDNLPDDAELPVIRKFDPSQFPVIQISVSGPMNEYRLRELAEDFVAPRLESIKGVASATVWEAGYEKSRSMWIGPNWKGIISLWTKYRRPSIAGHMDLPGGSLKTAQRAYGVRTLGRTPNIKDIEEIVVTNHNGVPVRVRDVAKVTDGFQDRDSIASINGVKGVTLNVLKQMGETPFPWWMPY